MDKSIKNQHYLDLEKIYIKFKNEGESVSLPNLHAQWFIKDACDLIRDYYNEKSGLTAENWNEINMIISNLLILHNFPKEDKDRLKRVKEQIKKIIKELQEVKSVKKGIIKKVVPRLKMALPFVGIIK